MSSLKTAIALLIVLLLVCPAAVAQETPKATTETESGETAAETEPETAGVKNWEFELAPMYLWAISTSGDMTVKGDERDFDISFKDIADDINGAVTFHFEAVRKQSWGFFTDFMYINLNPEDGDIDFKQILAEAAAFYRLTEGKLFIDGFAGLRYSAMDVEFEFGDLDKDIDQRKDWIDPFLGLKWKWNISDKWSTKLRGDAGGFGVGSRITVHGVGMVNFMPWKHVGFFGGYRVLHQDYSTGKRSNRFKFDATMHGPVLGLNIRW